MIRLKASSSIGLTAKRMYAMRSLNFLPLVRKINPPEILIGQFSLRAPLHRSRLRVGPVKNRKRSLFEVSCYSSPQRSLLPQFFFLIIRTRLDIRSNRLQELEVQTTFELRLFLSMIEIGASTMVLGGGVILLQLYHK